MYADLLGKSGMRILPAFSGGSRSATVDVLPLAEMRPEGYPQVQMSAGEKQLH